MRIAYIITRADAVRATIHDTLVLSCGRGPVAVRGHSLVVILSRKAAR